MVGGGGDLDWNNALNWDTDLLPGAADDVIVPDLVGDVTITHSSGATSINSLDSAESLTLSGGSMDVAGSVQVDATFTINGGTLANATVLAGGATSELVVTSSDGTLDGVTLALPTRLEIGAQVTVLNGLTVNSTVSLERSSTSTSSFLDVALNFSGGVQTLGGTGEVVFNGVNSFSGARQWVRPTAGGELIIGPGITVRTGTSGGVVGDGALPLTNQGTLVIDSAVSRQ